MRTLILAALLGLPLLASAGQTLLNVSYDPTRELYEQVNTGFRSYWKSQTGQDVMIKMSHGGSASQSRAVIEGLEADVVTLGAASDIDALHARGDLVPANWQTLLPEDSTPYTSTVVFLVRQGNPKHIRDWDDLLRDGVGVVTPNPKTSAGARWNFLAAYAYARSRNPGNAAAAKAFVKALFKHVSVLPTGARATTLAFTRQGQGDVLLAWENEAYLAIQEAGPGKFQIVEPSISMLAQPPVAVVEKNTVRHGTQKLAEAYLRYLYQPAAQEIIARNFYRPIDPQVAAWHARQFPAIRLVNISAFGGWAKAQAEFFADGALFDQLYE
jgi:sulfate transport system substrate-binding protein